MAKAITLCIIFILSNFLTVYFVVGEHNGLTIKLIHRDSPESPFYQSDLTYSQRLVRIFDQSITRPHYLSKFPTGLQSKVNTERFFYSAQIGVGSFEHEPFKFYNFIVDVGSELTWVECQDCKLPGNHCLRQNGEPFPDRTSKSYQRILFPTRGQGYPFCDPNERIGKYCGYYIKYFDNSSSKGFLAHETFTFDATGGGRKESVSNLIFGCGFDIRNMVVRNGTNIAGVLGLGWKPRSFVHQLGDKSKGKFSYCLQSLTRRNSTTYLQFGDNIPKPRAMYNMSLRPYAGEDFYLVYLTGISVAGQRLDAPEHIFARKHNRTGGCAMHTGSAVSLIVNIAYVQMKKRLIENIDKARGFVRVQVPRYDLCYRRTRARQGFKNLPSMTFHFQEANLQLQPQSIFWI